MCEQITLYAIIHFEKEKYKEDMSLNQENKATGRPSEERKWMQYYPEMMLNLIQKPQCTVWEYLEVE